MNSFKACIESLLKFNNDLDNLILYPNQLTGEEEENAIKIQKILNKNSEEILNGLSEKFKKFKTFKKEYQALLIVFYGDLNFSENFNIETWESFIDTTELIDNKEDVSIHISQLLG